MHENDRPATSSVLKSLLRDQAPELADLPLRRVAGGGTDNVIFRLGADLCARLPRHPEAATLCLAERQALAGPASDLPLSTPRLVLAGRPGQGHLWPWNLTTWLPGRDALSAPPADPQSAAQSLAGFIAALAARPLPAAGAAPPGPQSLSARDTFLRSMIARVTDEADPRHLTRIWDNCLALPPFGGPPVWVHGDLHPLNLVTRRGRLCAVIDWGCAAPSDPAHDLAAGWYLFDRPARDSFRDALAPAPADWARARALAFSKAVMALPYYRDTNPRLCTVMRRTLARVLDDPET